jgi:hypothetical protein
VPLPDRVQAFPTRRAGRTGITSSPGTSAVVESVRGQRTLVAGTVHDLADLERDGVLVGGILPSHLVMPQVDLAVIACGQGSVQCALASVTPLIALPLQPEQDLNGQLVERRGAGRRMTFADAATPKLTAAVREMLADPTYRSAKRCRPVCRSRRSGPAAAAILAATTVGRTWAQRHWLATARRASVGRGDADRPPGRFADRSTRGSSAHRRREAVPVGPRGGAARERHQVVGSTRSSTSRSTSQVPDSRARATAARPAGRSRPEASSRAIRALFAADQRLVGRRGVSRREDRSSSTLRGRLSTHPTQSASSTTAS